MRPDPERMIRVLCALGDTSLRVGWLTSELRHSDPVVAAMTLNALVEESEQCDPNAREACFTLVMVLVGEERDSIRALLRPAVEAHQLLALGRLLRQGGALPLQAAVHTGLPVPDYGVGRELTLGERRSLARRPSRRSFQQLLADPHPMVVQLLLINPKLTEADVLILATKRPARCETLYEIARSPLWLRRSRVRMALLLNPGTPSELSMPLIALCTRTDLIQVLRSADTWPTLRATARELLERRPPMAPDFPLDVTIQ